MFRSLSARTWRVVIVSLVALLVVGGLALSNLHQPKPTASTVALQPGQTLAAKALGELAIKSSLSHAGYNREQFGNGWAMVGRCDMRSTFWFVTFDCRYVARQIAVKLKYHL